MTFGDAAARLTARSDSLAAARAGVRNKQDLLASTRRLSWPEVTVELREQVVNKTLELPFGSLAPVAADFGLSNPLRFAEREAQFRPIVAAVVPVYSGGQIPAARAAATSAVRQADAELRGVSESLAVQLVQAYFGQQLAERSADVRRQARDGLQQHVDRTDALQAQGFATRAQQLQATVAKDRAEREYQRSVGERDTAYVELAELLRFDQRVGTTTNLFVISTPIATLEQFQRDALSQHPQLARLTAIRDQSLAAVAVQQAAFKPQIYAFGQYDLYRQDAPLTDPDWVTGVGLKFTLLSNAGRRERVSAARQQVAQVESSHADLAVQITVRVTRAYNTLESARRQFLLLESSLSQALENLRLQELSFREGEATSLDVIDARLELARAQIDQATTAFQFDVALAALLEVTGQGERFVDYIHQADRVITP